MNTMFRMSSAEHNFTYQNCGFFSVLFLQREFKDGNQTAALIRPAAIDSGQFKCVGYGHTEDVKVTHEISVKARSHW